MVIKLSYFRIKKTGTGMESNGYKNIFILDLRLYVFRAVVGSPQN